MSETEPTTETTETKPNAAQDIITNIAEGIKGSSDVVKNKFIQKLVDKEIDARVNVLDKAFAALEEARTTVKKCKPDQETFDASGKVVSSTFSKAKYEELKKAKEQVSALETMINKALENDWSKVKEKFK